MIRWELYLTVVGDFDESFLRLLLRVIGKATDLCDFDSEQVVMARWLRMSISQTV